MINFIDGLLIGIMITILFTKIHDDIECKRRLKIFERELAECKEEGIPIEMEENDEER